MTSPSLTLRSLQNEETGIDISVPRFQEVEAPLGGYSVLYEIFVLTKLDLFKTRLHKNEDVVQFSVYKAYREIEDLYNKLKKKFPKTDLPQVPRSSTMEKYTSDEKLKALDHFFQAVARNIEICFCSTFTQFVGINSQKMSSVSTPVTAPENSNLNESEKQTKNSSDLSDVFPKVKNASSKLANSIAQSTPLNIDLFEEVKQVKDRQTASDIKKKTCSGGLFDELDDDSLFIKKTEPKIIHPVKQSNEASEGKLKEKTKLDKKVEDTENADDGQIIIKDRKLGDISLFKEQDLGDYITEEESLFLNSSKNGNRKENMLLFSKDSNVLQEDLGLHENLDDLLNLNPLPTVSSTQTEKKYSNVVHNEHLSKKPVPLPRKKLSGKNDKDEHNADTKPDVMPRKVFLNKPDVPSKPVNKPSISTKPSLLPKPKPPVIAPKPTLRKDLEDVNANKCVGGSLNVTDDLNKLDILKYIEQEQKSLQSEPNLFD